MMVFFDNLLQKNVGGLLREINVSFWCGYVLFSNLIDLIIGLKTCHFR